MVAVASASALAPVVVTAPVAGQPVAAVAPTASAGATMVSASEGDFLSAINSLRASKGLRTLQVSGQMASVARSWTSRMASAGAISHNPSLAAQAPGDWTKVGENVGVGWDVPSLMAAFQDSPTHYANLVDPAWTHVGVGVQTGPDGRIYTTHDFVALPVAPPHLRPPRPGRRW